LTMDGIAEALSKVSEKEIRARYYTPEEAEALRAENLIVDSQVTSSKKGFQVNFEALEEYPIKFTSFERFLEGRKMELVESLRF